MNETDLDRQQRAQTSQDRDQGLAASARQRAADAYDSARSSVSGAGRRASESLDEAPLLALAGGLAAGALIAALLPRTDAETRALRPIGKRIKGSAGAAAQAAKDAGTARLGELGLTKDRGSDVLRSIIEGATDAAKTSAQAALSAARTRD